MTAACGTTTIVSGNSSDAGTAPADDAGAITDDGGGTGDDAGFDTPTTCTSGTTWTRGDRGSASMHPGGTCITCHESQRDAPTFVVAGTVYPSAHEPDDCNGISGTGTTVVITDAKGKATSLQVNAVGNFYSAVSITPPFSAKVVKNGQERAMGAMQTNGDCNSCHTETGTSAAPGRIVSP